MPRVKRGTKLRKRHKKLLKLAEGYYGRKHLTFRAAKETVEHALVYAYRDRRQKRRDFRQLWQIRLGAALKEMGLSYSRFMGGMKTKGALLNRKMLSEIAATQPEDFVKLVNELKA